MNSQLSAFLLDDSGQGLVEYSLILLLVAIAGITGLTFFGTKTNASINTSANRMP